MVANFLWLILRIRIVVCIMKRDMRLRWVKQLFIFVEKMILIMFILI